MNYKKIFYIILDITIGFSIGFFTISCLLHRELFMFYFGVILSIIYLR